jgi:hypothetical protein
MAKTLNNMGEAYRVQGRLDAARLRLGEALAIKRKLFSPGHLEACAKP